MPGDVTRNYAHGRRDVILSLDVPGAVTSVALTDDVPGGVSSCVTSCMTSVPLTDDDGAVCVVRHVAADAAAAVASVPRAGHHQVDPLGQRPLHDGLARPVTRHHHHPAHHLHGHSNAVKQHNETKVGTYPIVRSGHV